LVCGWLVCGWLVCLPQDLTRRWPSIGEEKEEQG